MLPLSSSQVDGRAFSEAMEALAPDLPLLMFGSGDVQPDEVNADTVALVAELTVQYMNRLVDAAVGAHDILTDGAGGLLPPAALPLNRVPQRPSSFSEDGVFTTIPVSIPNPMVATTSKGTSASRRGTTATMAMTTVELKKKRIRKKANKEYWDDPLPEPKIRKQQQETQSDGTIGGNSNVKTNATTAAAPRAAPMVHVDEWVGVSGVDFYETTRARNAYVVAPTAITTKCFIFPICHDAGLYGRVMEIQSARRNITPYLADPVWAELVRTEGSRRRIHVRSSNKSSANDGDGGDNGGEREEDDDEDNEVEDIIHATWPGLESLLPIHRGPT